ncbi:MAG TPA: hypothetical protein VLB07_08585, partial [Woeseiaceae bacterium]|nr:hypothetical protein [Woeseiaceae bacterium]
DAADNPGGDPSDRGSDGTGYAIRCATGNTGGGDDCFDGAVIFDIEASYTFADRYTVAIGADNVLDEEGALDIRNISDDGTLSLDSGALYSDTTPWGIDGGFWYVRLTAQFD